MWLPFLCYNGCMVLICILSLLFAVVLELNHNTVIGWALLAVLAVAAIVIYRKTTHKILLVLGFVACFVLILFLTWPPTRAVKASEDKNPALTEVVMTDKGPVQGVTTASGEVEVFAGIPYAKPPVGELRFRAPQDADSWTDVRICDEFAPMSMQRVNLPIYQSLTRIVGFHDYKISLSDNWVAPVSEDSLYLNVWKPAGKQENLPVLVYIHGGSLQTGQSWYSDYNGTSFAKEGIVVVSMAYRLGVFGFYTDEETTANCGLLDQIKALQWVKKNIEQFGGDPDNVTIAGESAGAVCVDALCVSPQAKGLFKRAILESSTLSCVEPPHSFRSYEEALQSGKDLKQRYGCNTADDLRKLPAKKIVNEMDSQHHVTVDGYVLPKTPYELRSEGIHNEEALLHGFNDKESGPFIIFAHANMKNYESKLRGYFGDYADDILEIYPASTNEEADKYWAEIYGAVFFNYPHYCLNRLAVKEGIPVYEYLFTKSNGMLSSWHSGELIYAFDRIPEGSKLFNQEDRNLSKLMNNYWKNFIVSGNPGFDENTSNTKLYEFGEHIGFIDEPYLKLYSVLDRMQGWK